MVEEEEGKAVAVVLCGTAVMIIIRANELIVKVALIEQTASGVKEVCVCSLSVQKDFQSDRTDGLMCC